MVLVPLIASNCDSAWALNTFSLSNAFSNLIIRVIAFSVMLLVWESILMLEDQLLVDLEDLAEFIAADDWCDRAVPLAQLLTQYLDLPVDLPVDLPKDCCDEVDERRVLLPLFRLLALDLMCCFASLICAFSNAFKRT
jgi:hypothetical protein